jgi:hypothetical protein
MNTASQAWPERQPYPAAIWWMLLALVLAVHLTLGWIAAAILLGLALVQARRPFDFLIAYLIVIGGASFVDYTRGQLTRELSLLSVGIVFMLFCYVMTQRSRVITVPATRLTAPLLGYLALTLFNFVRGMVEGNSLRYGGLELIAALAVACTFLIANASLSRTAIATALTAITLTALGNSALGFMIFAEIHQRTGSVYFTAVPGLVALVLFNFALRAPRVGTMWLWLLVLLPMLLHQFLSFTRGFWISQIGGLLYSIAAFGGLGRGAMRRWQHALLVVGCLLLLASGGVLLLASRFGIQNLLDLASSRLVSSTGTRLTFETSSNVVRLVEYARVIRDIRLSPWWGHGLGYFFTVREPIHFRLSEQWYCHESYLMVWLKQGLLGLALFLWVLWSAFKMGHLGSRSESGWPAAWCAASAAVTVFVAIYGLVYFVLVAEVNTAFLIALLWGGAMAFTRQGGWRVRWGRPGDSLGTRP